MAAVDHMDIDYADYASPAISSTWYTNDANGNFVSWCKDPEPHITEILPVELHLGILEILAKELSPEVMHRWLYVCPQALKIFQSYHMHIMGPKYRAINEKVLHKYFNWDSAQTVAAHRDCQEQATMLAQWRDFQMRLCTGSYTEQCEKINEIGQKRKLLSSEFDSDDIVFACRTNRY